MTTPADMPARTAPLGRTEERRLRARAKTRLYKLVNQLPDRDADQLLALHEALDGFYAELNHLHAEQEDDDR